MTSHADIGPLAAILLETIAKECNTTQEHLSLETEQVVTNALMAAYNKGYVAAHERPTVNRPVDPNDPTTKRRPSGTF